MIQRSVYLKDNAVKEIANQLESKEAIINNLQQKTAELKINLTTKNEETEILNKQVQQLEESFETNQKMLDNNQALITEYKEKNDVLNGLVAQLKRWRIQKENRSKDDFLGTLRESAFLYPFSYIRSHSH